MKDTDKKIIYTLSSIVYIILLYGLFFHPIITLQVLGSLLLLAYGFFILFHLGLLIPLFAIIIFTGGFLDNYTAIGRIKDNSIIIYRFIHTLILIPIFFAVYVCIPVLAAMLIEYTTSVDEAIIFLKPFFED